MHKPSFACVARDFKIYEVAQAQRRQRHLEGRLQRVSNLTLLNHTLAQHSGRSAPQPSFCLTAIPDYNDKWFMLPSLLIRVKRRLKGRMLAVLATSQPALMLFWLRALLMDDKTCWLYKQLDMVNGLSSQDIV